jgi:hypothetical protein
LAIIAEFEVVTHRAKTMELLNLRQSGSVDEYRKAFEQLVYNIRLFGSFSQQHHAYGTISIGT